MTNLQSLAERAIAVALPMPLVTSLARHSEHHLVFSPAEAPVMMATFCSERGTDMMVEARVETRPARNMHDVYS